MNLWIPATAAIAMDADDASRPRARADQLVDLLQAEIESAVGRLVAVANEDGARRMAAAIFLVRANGLLEECRTAVSTPTICVLGLRSVFELAVVGRYMLVGIDAQDEFARRFNDALGQEGQLAVDFHVNAGGAVDFLAAPR